ncbi:DNA-directed RNA polymerase [Fonsecaea pedrosoi]|nr:DNA-directed RNA polymerase [Fonsecaea pedrosoi]
MVVFSKSAALAALAFLAAAADAHMIMKTPVPYGKSSLNNSPLLADGSDFPCKQRSGVYDAEGASNVAAIGEPQTLSFLGSAVHGGGSCQVSLTTDLQPTKNSKWMVIKSIEGGCPASVAGNLPADPSGTGASTFQFSVPDGISPGDYTLSWTWYNKVGNREIYQNCAPFTVTAAKKKRYAPAPKTSKRATSFPDLFVCNLPSINDCSTVEGFDYHFPDPGADVQQAGTGPYTMLAGASGNAGPPSQPTNSLPAAQSPSAPATSGPAPTGPPSSGPPAGQPPAGQPPAFASGNGGQYSGSSQATPTAAPGNFASGASSVPASVPTSSTSANPLQVIPVTTQATAVSTAAVAAPTGASSGSSSGSAAGVLTGPCSNEGYWNCIDGASFQRCASGSWSAVLPLSGMKCSPGVAANFAMTAANARRWAA